MVGIFGNIGSRAVVCGSLVLSGLLSSAFAQGTQNDTKVPSSIVYNGNGDDQVVLAVNVPEGADKTDLYFHFEAPAADHSWAAFGLGNRMKDALMFVVYRSQDNQGEPTVSVRIASGQSEPQFTKAVNVSVLENSSATDDRFVANIHCLGCRDWGVAKVDVSSNEQPFIYALGPDGDLQSDDKSAKIDKHQRYQYGLSIDMKAATGVAGLPFVDPKFSSNDTDNNSNNGVDDGYTEFYSSRSLVIHGIILCFAFTIVFPGGYLFLRLFERVWLHAGIQSFGLLLVVIGIGLGIGGSIRDNISPSLTHPHQIIGLIILILILATWTVGLIGHRAYKRTQVPHPLMKSHRILGPLTIFLGFVNACIGLAWVGLTRAIIGYTLFNVLVLIAVGGLAFMMKKRKMRRSAQTSVAANNFREGQTYDSSHMGMGAPPAYAPGQSMPMQTFASQGPQEHGRVEYYNVQPNK